jgi:predicted CXXCH cytochrome family protein
MARAAAPINLRSRMTPFGCAALLVHAPLVVVSFAGSSQPVRPEVKPAHETPDCTKGGCHAAVIAHKVMHGPAAQAKCLDCHQYASTELHLFRFTTPQRELCDSCHTIELKATVHTPVADRNCTGCHDPHGSSHKMMLKAPASPQLCFTCHDQSIFTQKFVHGPVAIGACNICHDPHSTSHERLLTQSVQQLCIDCHNETKPEGLAARTMHKPMEQGCLSCHNPHASETRYHLHESVPNLCFTCHEGMQKTIAGSTVHHGPVDSDGGCVTCHTPHFSHLPALQRTAQPETCLSCHNKPVTTPDGRSLTNMFALLRDNHSHHGPIRDGNCTSCHQPHAGERFGMLHEEYPQQFYASFDVSSYQLCFSCHSSELVTDPSGVGLTRFRDGEVNLHWMHVNKEKGRTCRACHEVHASKRPFHIREAVPFGTAGWMLEINFEQSEDGGSCAPGCHVAENYDRTNGRLAPIPVLPAAGGEGDNAVILNQGVIR